MAIRTVKVSSNLMLQKLLYYNLFLSVIFFVAHLVILTWKSMYLESSTVKIIVSYVILALFGILDALRLNLGYSGNLRERVQELSAFVLMTLLLQLPIVVFLSIIQLFPALPIDTAIGIPSIVVLLLEFIYGIQAVRSNIRRQTIDFFYLCRVEMLARNKPLIGLDESSSSAISYDEKSRLNSELHNIQTADIPTGMSTIMREALRLGRESNSTSTMEATGRRLATESVYGVDTTADRTIKAKAT